MEWEYTSLKNQPKLDEYKKNLHFSDFPLIFFYFFSDFVHFFWNYPIFSWNFPMFGESGNDGRGIGESGRAKIHSPGNRGVKMCRVTRGMGSPGSPWQPYMCIFCSSCHCTYIFKVVFWMWLFFYLYIQGCFLHTVVFLPGCFFTYKSRIWTLTCPEKEKNRKKIVFYRVWSRDL